MAAITSLNDPAFAEMVRKRIEKMKWRKWPTPKDIVRCERFWLYFSPLNPPERLVEALVRLIATLSFNPGGVEFMGEKFIAYRPIHIAAKMGDKHRFTSTGARVMFGNSRSKYERDLPDESEFERVSPMFERYATFAFT